MGKTFKDQKHPKRKPNLPRVRIDWDTGTRVHPDERKSPKRPKQHEWPDEDWNVEEDLGDY